MHADGPSAPRTRPSLFLIPQKLPHAKIPDGSEILDHTHIVFGPVSLVQVLDPIAGILFAFITILQSVSLDGFAGFDFTANTGDFLPRVVSPAAGTLFLLPQVSHAYRAIHPAGGDE